MHTCCSSITCNQSVENRTSVSTSPQIDIEVLTGRNNWSLKLDSFFLSVLFSVVTCYITILKWNLKDFNRLFAMCNRFSKSFIWIELSNPHPMVWLSMCLLSNLSHVRLFANLWTLASQAPLSMGLSRHKYWIRLSCPSPGDLPKKGIKLTSLLSPSLAGRFLTTSGTWEASE